MLGLSLNPPWGTLIAVAANHPDLGKRIETRDWQRSYRGPLAIHQTKGLSRDMASEADLAVLCRQEPFCSALAAIGITEVWQLPRGAVVAVVQLVAICPTAGGYARDSDGANLVYQIGYARHGQIVAVSDRERAFGDYGPGRHAWLLDDIQSLRAPIRCRGTQGLWPVPPDVAAQLARLADRLDAQTWPNEGRR